MGRSPGVRGRSRSGPRRRRRTCGPSGRRRAGRRRCAGRARRRSAGARCRSCRCPCGSRAAAARPPARRPPAAASSPSASTSLPLARKRTRPPLAAEARGGGDGPEALEVQSLGHAGALEAVGQRVQQAGRTAGPGLALAPVGHAPVEPGDVPAAVAVVVVLVQRVAVMARARARADRRRRSCPRATGRRARARRRAGRPGGARALAASP